MTRVYSIPSGTGTSKGTTAVEKVHLASGETGGLVFQGARCFPSCSGGRNHSETCEGCIVSCW